MIRFSLIHRIFLWILIPIACVIGFVFFQLQGMITRLSDQQGKDIVGQVARVENELQLVLDTTEQLTEMISRDSRLLGAYKNRETDFLYQVGSNSISSKLVDQVTFVDLDGTVLARGHDEFAFNDTLATDPFFRMAARHQGFSGIVQREEGISFLVVLPIMEFGTVFRGALLVSRHIVPPLVEKMEKELGLTIVINHLTQNLANTTDEKTGTARFGKQLPFLSIDPTPWFLTINKSYAAELGEFKASRFKILLFSLIATTFALIFVYVSLGYLLRPMRRLQSWLKQYKEGDLRLDDLDKNIITQNNKNNELDYISHSALTTIQELEAARPVLQQFHQSLERLVEERTSQLSIKTEQLRAEVREREQAESKIQGLKNHLQSIFDSMTCALVGVDVAGSITFLNVQAQKISGLHSDDMKGAPVERMLKVFDLTTEDILGKTTHESDQWQFRRYTTQHAGATLYLDITTYPFRYDTEEGTIIRIDDVTNQVSMEQELLKVEKLRSIGLLAGGIAHDFNNFLVAILGNINLSMFDTTLTEKTRALLMKAEKACMGAKDLTGQLLIFAKGGEPRKKITDLAEVVRNAVNLAVNSDHFTCHFSIPDNLWPADIDRGQIERVIQNIVINATQAIPGGGVIEIDCENVRSEGDNHLVQLPPGPYIRISVTDHGSGMPTKILSRIFDPYFSTKSDGYGLGLAICYSIIKKHEGIIAVESYPGAGTTFFIFLPGMPGETVFRDLEMDDVRDEHQSFRILVMDDEQMVREVLGAMLDLLGHQVIFAQDGDEAIKKYQDALDSGTPVDIIFMDLVIPGGMGGKEAVKRIHQISPVAKVIVSSGYSSDPVLANFQAYGFSAAIAKPFQLKELAHILKEVRGHLRDDSH